MLESLPDEDSKRCPNCAELIRKDAILCRFCEKGISDEHFAPCPLCAESIRKEAVFCRFCRSKLVAQDSENQQLQVQIEELRDQTREMMTALQTLPSSPSIFKFDDETLNRIFKDNLGITEKIGGYGSGVRQQVFEVIVRQAMAGALWKEICAVPMQVNNISVEEVELEIARRKSEIVPEDSSFEEKPEEHGADVLPFRPLEEPSVLFIQEQLRGDIEKIMALLSPRERDVLRLRFGLYDGRQRTLEEVAELFNTTRERIRQIEAKALRKLRYPPRD